MHLCPGTLSDTDNPVLVGVEDLPHFAHGLGVCGGGGKVPIQVQPPKQTSPAVVALSSVGQTPRHQGLALWHQSAMQHSDGPHANCHLDTLLNVPVCR